MYSLEEPGDRVAIVQMNAELRHAQLEMLSAQCATDRLRLRYSAEDLAQHAQRDTLRKAWASASALCDYYNMIVKLMPDAAREKSGGLKLSEVKIVEATDLLAQYLHEQRERYRPMGVPLDGDSRAAMAPFFPAMVLDQVRIAKLDRQRVANPAFYAEAKAMGITNLPELVHMTHLTFEDVLVFQGEMTPRALFHGLVHMVQFDVLGLEMYSELFVRGFIRTRSHINVPLEVHAFMLESAFADNPAKPFSVEEKVRLWRNQGRY
jgi:hypothetical protein